MGRGAVYALVLRCLANIFRGGRKSFWTRTSSLGTLVGLASVYSLGSCGFPGQGALRFLAGLGPKKYRITGTVAPGWERVREAFELNFVLGLEKGAQCCVYHKGVKVVDLAGTLGC